MPPSIRLFHPDALASSDAGQEAPIAIDGLCELQTVSVRLGDLLPILVQAVQDRRGWVTDFYDDTVDIPQDLYEVVLAYQQQTSNTRRRAA